ncbi:hypothetical protein CARN8_4460002 [mine drainage metagenome]|uniref:Uncharacterized protein n=1 Tax=mine drainage metagenome TaxID=410659 RepID=A0A3P3ZPT8_9ZZZZ
MTAGLHVFNLVIITPKYVVMHQQDLPFYFCKHNSFVFNPS